MGGGARSGSAPTRSSCRRAFEAYTEASKAVFAVFERHDAAGRGALDRRGLPRHPRDGALSGDAGRDRGEARRDVRERRRPADHRRGGEDEVPREGGERRGEARRPARRAAGRRARLPPPAAGGAPLGRRAGDGRASCTGSGSQASARSPAFPRASLMSIVGRAAGRHLHALAHNRDPRPVRARRRRGSIGSQRALGRRGGRRRTWTRSSSGSSTASPGACAGPGGSAARSSCGCASTTSPARLARTRCRGRPPRRARSSPPPGSCSPRRGADDRPRGLTLLGISVSNLDDDDAVQLDAAVRPARAGRTRRGARRGPRPLRHRRDHARRCCSAATRASRCRCSRTEASRPDRRRATGTRGRPHATRRCPARAVRQAGAASARSSASRSSGVGSGFQSSSTPGRLKAPTSRLR